MASGRQSDQWNHTADLLCAVHRAWMQGEFHPSDFHPDTMGQNAGAGRKANGFDARMYAIGLCGMDAIEKFRKAAARKSE